MKGGTLSLYRDPQRLIRDERHFVSTWWRIVLCQHMDAYGPLPKHFFWQISYRYAYRLGVPNLPKISRKSNICFCNFSADDMQKRDLDMHNHNLRRNVTHLDLDAIVPSACIHATIFVANLLISRYTAALIQPYTIIVTPIPSRPCGACQVVWAWQHKLLLMFLKHFEIWWCAYCCSVYTYTHIYSIHVYIYI